MQIIVLGMHRSGTSTVTRILNLMGAYFGPEGVATAANQENPKGFWERRDLRELTDKALRMLDSDWNRVSGFDLATLGDEQRSELEQEFRRLVERLDAHRPWVLKDPRLCLLTPIWRSALEAPLFVHVHRCPIEVARSLETRNSLPLVHGVSLWEFYTRNALAASQGAPRVLISYTHLIAKPLEAARRLYQDLVAQGVRNLRLPSKPELLAFVDEKLYRERASSRLRAQFLNSSQQELAERLDARTIFEDEEPALGISDGALSTLRLFDTSQQQQARAEEAARLADEVARSHEDRSRAAAECDALRAKVDAFEKGELGLREAVAELQRVRTESEARALRQQVDLEEREAEVATLLSVRDRLTERLRALKQERSVLRRDCESLRGEGASTHQELGSLRAERLHLDERARELEHARTQLGDELLSASRQSEERARVVNALKEENAQLREVVATASGQRDRVEERVRALETECDGLRRSAEGSGDELAALRRQSEALKADLREARGAREQLGQELEAVERERSALAQRVTELQREREELGRLRTTLEAERSDLIERGARLAECNEKLLRGQGELEIECSLLEARTTELELARGALIQERDEIERARSGLADRVAGLERKREELTRVGSELRGEREALEARCRELSEQRQQLEHRLAACERDLVRMRGWLNRLSRHVPNVLDSRRLRIGNAIGNVFCKLTGRAITPLDSAVRDALREYQAWAGPRTGRERAGGGSVPAERRVDSTEVRIQPPRPRLVPGSVAAFPPRAPGALGSRRKRVVVVAWDAAHNPLGRAYLLADVLRTDHEVELVGAIFHRYGNDVWEPLRDAPIPIRTFQGTTFPEHFHRMVAFSKEIDADVVYVSKPRLPSLELGILLKQRSGQPLILDIDDDELSFFNADRPLSLEEIKAESDDQLRWPYEGRWTRYCQSLVRHADFITVSNAELQRKFGGFVVPHARDERLFSPERFDRERLRGRFGYRPGDRVIAFIGTPRPHKGVSEIIAALQELGNPDYKLCVIGSAAEKELKATASYGNAAVQFLPNSSLRSLPDNLCIADLVCIPQDPKSPICQYQMPAKFTDALAMGIPILASDVPPLRRVAARGLANLYEGADLGRRIDEIFSNHDRFKQRALDNRRSFLAEYSYTAARKTLNETIDSALAGRRTTPPAFTDLIDLHSTRYSSSSPPRSSTPSENPGQRGTRRVSDSRPRNRRRYVDEKYNIVFFWKQNDSGIYGRRADMLAKYLAQHPRINVLVHFDAPMAYRELFSLLRDRRKLSQSRLVFANTARRMLRLQDEKRLKRRTFVHRTRGKSGSATDATHPDRPARALDAYVRFVEKTLQRHQIRTRRTVFWVWPKSFEFPQLVRHCQPDLVLADIIDDHRTWPVSAPYRERLQKNYEEILTISDVVLCNSERVKDSMERIRPGVHLVPNACEPLMDVAGSWKKPERLKRMMRPIIGYVGNLDSDRLDVELIERIARANPNWSMVLIGSTHRCAHEAVLRRYANVSILGVVPYAESVRYIASFDAAILPHLDNELTQHMNPLKLFVYCSLGVPVVSTDVGGLECFRDLVRIAGSHDEFLRKLEECVAGNQSEAERAAIRKRVLEHSWEARTREVVRLLDEAFEKR